MQFIALRLWRPTLDPESLEEIMMACFSLCVRMWPLSWATLTPVLKIQLDKLFAWLGSSDVCSGDAVQNTPVRVHQLSPEYRSAHYQCLCWPCGQCLWICAWSVVTLFRTLRLVPTPPQLHSRRLFHHVRWHSLCRGSCPTSSSAVSMYTSSACEY